MRQLGCYARQLFDLRFLQLDRSLKTKMGFTSTSVFLRGLSYKTGIQLRVCREVRSITKLTITPHSPELFIYMLSNF